MTQGSDHDAWTAGQSYEQYMGRWSREIASRFVEWLDQPPVLDWLDIGCGTGALSATILERCQPRSVLGVDPSEGFLAHARAANPDERARFEVADASALPCEGQARSDPGAYLDSLRFHRVTLVFSHAFAGNLHRIFLSECCRG